MLLLYGPGDSVQAILPLALRRVAFRRAPVTALTWAIGDIGCPDHLDLLAEPGVDLDPLIAALEALPWEILILGNLAGDAPNIARLSAALARDGCVTRSAPLWSCPYLELPGSWDEYVGRLTPTRRQTLGRKQRKLHREHRVTITDYGGDRLAEGWTHLVALHGLRWAGGGVFIAPRIERLHRSFARQLAARDQLWLATLDLDGEPAAAWYGFCHRDTVYFYQGGRDPKWKHESVGLVLMAAMIRRAIERGYRRFDFLRGEETHKLQWTSMRHVTRELVVFRRGWRSGWLRALDWAGRLRTRLRGRSAFPAPVEDQADG